MVPVLYQGPLDLAKIEEVMADLKKNGSKLVEGFMRPEGCVVTIAGTRYKKVFDAEETQWKKSDGRKDRLTDLANQPDYSHLLQPIRLEKLLSRDEKFLREFPRSLPALVNAYFEDLVAEGQVTGTDAEIKAVRKGSSKDIFAFVRNQVEPMVALRELQG